MCDPQPIMPVCHLWPLIPLIPHRPPPPKKQKTPSKPSRPRVTCAPIAEASKRRSSRIAQLPAPNYNLDADDDSPRYLGHAMGFLE